MHLMTPACLMFEGSVSRGFFHGIIPIYLDRFDRSLDEILTSIKASGQSKTPVLRPFLRKPQFSPKTRLVGYDARVRERPNAGANP